MAVPARKRLTYTEYLQLEQDTDTRHEFLDGVAVAMAGGTARHSAVKRNLTGLAYNALKGRACRSFDADYRIRVLETGFATYPDLSVICGAIEPHPEDRHAGTNPTALFEVLSPSTEGWDRGGKFAQFRRIASLRHYVLVSVDKPLVEVYTRTTEGVWELREYRAGDAAPLAGIDVALDVSALYLDLPDPTEDPSEPVHAVGPHWV